jgi:hypothetical protein
MKKLNNIWLTILIILSFIGFVLGMVWFFIWKKEEIPAQIIGSLFGVLVSAIVTMLLLSAQTNSEEEHEVSGKIFDKKTEAYLNVLDSLEKIIADGKVDTIRDNRLDKKDDEFSKLLFSLTRLSSFVEKKNDSKNVGMNNLIDAVTSIIKTTTDEKTRLPGYESKEFWNGKGKKKPNETQRDYYSKLVESLAKISNFAANNIRRGSGENDLDLNKLISESGLFPDEKSEENETQIPESTSVLVSENSTTASEEPMDYRIGCIADCLKEMEKQLQGEFGVDSIERAGDGGDNTYWGRWKDKETSPETIADWLLDKSRRGFIGYKIDLKNGFSADLLLYGDAKSFYAYIYPASDEAKKQIDSKYDDVKKRFGREGIGWWIPDQDKLKETGWILGGTYGGLSFAFDFRNASMEEAEYKDKYQKFKSTAFQEMIFGRDDSIIKTVAELKKLLEQ